jgi:hypothetical protein
MEVLTIYGLTIKFLKDTRFFPRRSAWDGGVHLYALELLEAIEATDADVIKSINEGRAITNSQYRYLNGASSWLQYSEGANAFIYNEDIAERLETPARFKQGYDDLGCFSRERPNKRETYLEMQARALSQAWERIKEANTMALERKFLTHPRATFMQEDGSCIFT